MFGLFRKREPRLCRCGPPYFAGHGEFDRCVNCRLPFPGDAWRENFWDRPAPDTQLDWRPAPATATSGYMEPIPDHRRVHLTDDELDWLAGQAGVAKPAGVSTRRKTGLTGEGVIALRQKLELALEFRRELAEHAERVRAAKQ